MKSRRPRRVAWEVVGLSAAISEWVIYIRIPCTRTNGPGEGCHENTVNGLLFEILRSDQEFQISYSGILIWLSGCRRVDALTLIYITG